MFIHPPLKHRFYISLYDEPELGWYGFDWFAELAELAGCTY